MSKDKTGTNVPEQPTVPPAPKCGGSAAYRPTHNVKIGVETEGMDEATAKIEGLADALGYFPVQVEIKGAKNCSFNIYPSQTQFQHTTQTEGEHETANGI